MSDFICFHCQHHHAYDRCYLDKDKRVPFSTPGCDDWIDVSGNTAKEFKEKL